MARSVADTDCPAENILADWLIGILDDATSDRIDEHTAVCSFCDARIDVLENHLRVPPLSKADEDATPDLDGMERAAQLKPIHGAEPPNIADYRILRELGRGGMGVVYEAEHTKLQRRVALKVLPRAFAADRLAVQRFELEAQSAASLHHPHIVPIYEIGFEDGHHFFAMQLLPGGSLDGPRRDGAFAALEQRRFSHRQVAELGTQVARALQFAHSRGVIHRDIKPANLLLDDKGDVWVSDFGLAKRHDVELTSAGTLVGTLRYMPPERIEGVSDDPRSDIYSLGATLYELLACRPAFREYSYLQLIDHIHHQPPPKLETRDPSIPPDLRTIVHKCLEKKAADRYPTAQTLYDDLERFLQSRPIFGSPRVLVGTDAALVRAKSNVSLVIGVDRLPLGGRSYRPDHGTDHRRAASPDLAGDGRGKSHQLVSGRNETRGGRLPDTRRRAADAPIASTMEPAGGFRKSARLGVVFLRPCCLRSTWSRF